MSRFQRLHSICAIITSVLAAGPTLNGLLSSGSPWWISLIGVVAGTTPWLPFLLRGGLNQHHRLALGIATFAALASVILQVGTFTEFVITGGGEGPRGEGSPAAIIVGMVSFAALVTGPWLITSLWGWVAFTQTPGRRE